MACPPLLMSAGDLLNNGTMPNDDKTWCRLHVCKVMLLENWKSQVQNYVPKGAYYCDREYLQIGPRVLTHHECRRHACAHYTHAQTHIYACTPHQLIVTSRAELTRKLNPHFVLKYTALPLQRKKKLINKETHYEARFFFVTIG